MEKSNKRKVQSLLLWAALFIAAGPVYAGAGDPSARSVLDRIINEKPAIRDGRVVLPASGTEKYRVVIGGSSNESVIAADGTIHTPLETMEVHLLYKVVSVADGGDTAMSTYEDVVVAVPGKYTRDAKDNARPETLPEIREWKGRTGMFKLGKQSRIVLTDASLLKTAEQMRYYLEKIAGRPFEVVVGEAVKGDICFSLSGGKELGKEGYSIDIDDIVKAEAPSAKGCLYAAVTLAQILSQSERRSEVPKGYIRDYPAYGVRGCMLDVARIYIPLGYVEEMVRYMAWFKINEVQMHINDDGGEQHASFRVESKKFPAINSGLNPDEVYSQDVYRRFQKDMEELGVDIITEIDTPAHCRFVALHNPGYMLNESDIDLTNEAAIGFIKDLYDEFLDDPDPVFRSRNFHIGADEYHRGPTYGDDFMRYLNTMIKYVNGKGLSPRMWASMGGGGLVGETPVDTNVACNYWAYSWADFGKMIGDGFACINNSHDIYVVPGRRTYYDDYFKLKKMYCCWETTDLSGNWPLLSPAHPLLLGCQASIWYDRKVGTSEFDYFDRQKDQAVFIAEKGWFGEKADYQTCEGFMKRVAMFAESVPGTNPGRKVPSEGEVIASYDFKSVKGGIVKDRSGNGYDAVADGLYVADGVLELDGRGSLSLPFGAVGYPYTVSFDLWIDPATPAKAVLFEGDEGTMFLNYDGRGNIGYERKGYKYVLPCTLPAGEWLSLALCCDKTTLCLYVDGELAAQGRYLEDPETIPDSSTFVLPVRSVGQGVAGKIKNFTIFNETMLREPG